MSVVKRGYLTKQGGASNQNAVMKTFSAMVFFLSFSLQRKSHKKERKKKDFLEKDSLKNKGQAKGFRLRQKDAEEKTI